MRGIERASEALGILREKDTYQVQGELHELLEGMRLEKRAMLEGTRWEEGGLNNSSNSLNSPDSWSGDRPMLPQDFQASSNGPHNTDEHTSTSASAVSNVLSDKATITPGQEHAYTNTNTPLLSPDMWRLLQKQSTSRALLLGCALQAAQQFGGINTVMYVGI